MRSKALNICEQFLPQQRVVVAGGYAVQSYSAKDLDLWVLGIGAEAVESLHKDVSVKADGSFFPSSDWGNYEMGILDLGILYFENFNLPVHLMGFWGEVYDLLSLFDISTHVAAWDPYTEERFKMERTTVPAKPPEIVWKSVRTADSTLERYIKICRRYGHLPDLATITKLLALWEKEGTS